MKRALTMLAAAIALPLLAGEPAKTTTAQPQPAATTATAAAAQPDSPLVAAAKRANRLGKKPKNLITNETLVKSNTASRITTTTVQGTLNMPAPYAPPAPTPEMEAAARAAEQRRKLEAEAKKRSDKAALRQQKIEKASAQAEEGSFDETDADSAQAERDLEAAHAQKPPQW